MDKLKLIEKQFLQNYQVTELITCNFISRNVIWNYLKIYNQNTGINWQTVKYNYLKRRVIQYWQKKKILVQDLSISELIQLLTSKTINFNEHEQNLLHIKLNNHVEDTIKNVGALHPIIIYDIIDLLSKLNDLAYQNSVNVLKNNLKQRRIALLEQMIQRKHHTQMHKEKYLVLKGVEYDNINLAFDRHFQSDRNKYFLNKLKQKSQSLYKNVNINNF